MTWEKESFGLFDFDSKSFGIQTLNFAGCGFLTMNSQALEFVNTKRPDQKFSENLLFSVAFKDSNYYVFNPYSFDLSQVI